MNHVDPNKVSRPDFLDKYARSQTGITSRKAPPLRERRPDYKKEWSFLILPSVDRQPKLGICGTGRPTIVTPTPQVAN